MDLESQCVQTAMTVVNVTLSAFAAAPPCCGAVAAGRPPPAAVDGYLLPAALPQQTRRTPQLRSIDETRRQTDRQTDEHQTYIFYADSVSNAA